MKDDKILSALISGATIKEAAALAGVSPATVKRCARKNREKLDKDKNAVKAAVVTHAVENAIATIAEADQAVTRILRADEKAASVLRAAEIIYRRNNAWNEKVVVEGGENPLRHSFALSIEERKRILFELSDTSDTSDTSTGKKLC